MAPGIAMCYYAGKGDISNMKNIYVANASAVNESDVNAVEFEVKDKEKQKKNDNVAEMAAISGDTPLHVAAGEGQMEALELLLNWEADIESKNRVGSTPLHRAASNGQVAAVKKLLENGGNVDATNKSGSTPLHCASYGGFVEIAKLLCEHGASKYIKRPNMTNMSPYDYAKSYKPMLDFFLTRDGKSPTRLEIKRTRDKPVTLHNIQITPPERPEPRPNTGSFRGGLKSLIEGTTGSFRNKNSDSFRQKFLDPERGSFRTKKYVTMVDTPTS